ncbi:Rv3235 family protein [Embleya sp. NBC_00896]|uniref:Rv3235 family protein n=1 Tax=Embleya sp. NBC_00896 TaxID=2975961 RepID=UPI0038632C95|nr:Rv3235 family protein [Embleya sp. NBC_00896]
MVHPSTLRTGSPPHLYIVRAPGGETPFDAPHRPDRPDHTIVPLHPRALGPDPAPVHGSLALAPRLFAPPDPRPALRLIVTPKEPDPAEARLRSRRLAYALAEIVSGLRAITQLRPYASVAVYGTARQLARRLAERRVGRMRVESCGGRAPADGVAEGYARLRAATWVLTVAFRLERDAATRGPGTAWLCTALEHDRLA